MSGNLNKILYGGIALAVIFLILPSLVLPMFNESSNYCAITKWYGADNGVLTNCTDVKTASNSSFVDLAKTTYLGQPLDQDNGMADQFCLNCETGGRVSMATGIIVIILIISLVGFAIYFVPKMRK